MPKRGILKSSTSFEQRERTPSDYGAESSSGTHHKNPHFDENNIMATLHPADKDYGFMKIEEPKTPYEYYSGNDDDADEEAASEHHNPGNSELNPTMLAAR